VLVAGSSSGGEGCILEKYRSSFKVKFEVFEHQIRLQILARRKDTNKSRLSGVVTS